MKVKAIFVIRENGKVYLFIETVKDGEYKAEIDPFQAFDLTRQLGDIKVGDFSNLWFSTE